MGGLLGDVAFLCFPTLAGLAGDSRLTGNTETDGHTMTQKHLLAYLESRTIERQEYKWTSLLFALMQSATPGDRARLKRAFPDAYSELSQRNQSPDGALSEAESRFIAKSTITAKDRWPKRI